MRIPAMALVMMLFVLVSCNEKKTINNASPLSRKTWVGFADLLMNEDFKQLENTLNECLKHNGKDELQRSLLTEAYECFGYSEEFLPHLNKWCIKSPQSHYPWLVRGKFYVDHAWRARGSGWASTISDDDYKLFEERLQLAQKDLKHAHALNPQDPNAATEMIRVCMGLSLDRAEMEKWFSAATKADPGHAAAHEAKLTYLMPKWGGSVEEMLAYARDCMLKAPDDSRVDKIIVEAHLEMSREHNEGPSWWKRPDVWHDLSSVYETRLSKNQNDIPSRNFLAYYAIQTGHYDVARNQFERIGIQWHPVFWQHVKDFLLARDDAFKKTSPGTAPDIGQWALAECEKMIAQNPDDYFNYFTRGCVFREMSQLEDSVKDLEKAVSLNQNDFRVHEELASSYAALNNGRKSIGRVPKNIGRISGTVCIGKLDW